MNQILEKLSHLQSIIPILALQSCFPWAGNFEVDDDIGVEHQEDESVLVRLKQEDLDIWRVVLTDDKLTMVQLQATDHPAQVQFEAVLTICGIRSGARNDAEALSDRADAIDSAWTLLHKMRQTLAPDPVVAAEKLLNLAGQWSRNRLARFESAVERPRLAEEEHQLRWTAVNMKDSVPVIDRIELHGDPRGSAFTVFFSTPGVFEKEVSPLVLNWTPATSVADNKPAPKRSVASKATLLPRPTKVDAKVLGFLSGAHVAGNEVSILQRLQPKAYAQVKVVLEELGGVWSTSRQAHVFEEDPKPVLAKLIEEGSMLTRRDYEFFPTPPHLVQRLIVLSQLKPGMKVLEPQAGSGAIAQAMAEVVGKDNVTCYELMPKNIDKLKALGFAVDQPVNFLDVKPQPCFDLILMNPPFSGGKDVAHVQHALKFLKPEGELWAIVSTSWKEADNQRSIQFRELVEQHGLLVEDVERGAFADAGTDVPTVLVGIKAPGLAKAPEPTKVVKAEVQSTPVTAEADQLALF